MVSLTVRQKDAAEAGAGARTGEDGFKEFGGAMKKDFLFAPDWVNLNHGTLCHLLILP